LNANRQCLSRVKFRGFAHHAKNGEAGDAARQIEIRHAINRWAIDRTIPREWSNGDSINALCI
jgi:hypothetical protein